MCMLLIKLRLGPSGLFSKKKIHRVHTHIHINTQRIGYDWMWISILEPNERPYYSNTIEANHDERKENGH